MDGKFILLGTNLGSKLTNLWTAISLMEGSGIKILKQSSIYESEPWGIKDQPWFLNMVVSIESTFTPQNLLETLLVIETEMGRTRAKKWGERLIDLDILYLDDMVLESSHLTVPHPGIPDRKFTLMPLVEIAPDFIHPLLGKSNQDLLSRSKDPLSCIQSNLTLLDVRH